MGILENHQKTNIRFTNKDLIFYEPSNEQLKEIKEMLEKQFQEKEDLNVNKELDIKSTRLVIRELTNIGSEIDEYSDEELLNKLDNGDRVLKLLLREVQKFINEIIDDIFEEKIEKTKALNTLMNIVNSKQNIESVKNKMDKFFKKHKINIKFEELQNIKNNPKIMEELSKKLNSGL